MVTEDHLAGLLRSWVWYPPGGSPAGLSPGLASWGWNLTSGLGPWFPQKD